MLQKILFVNFALTNIYELNLIAYLLKQCVYDIYWGGSLDLGIEHNDKAENLVNWLLYVLAYNFFVLIISTLTEVVWYNIHIQCFVQMWVYLFPQMLLFRFQTFHSMHSVVCICVGLCTSHR